MKIRLELVINEDDGRVFLNFWDFRRGKDVCAQVIDGRLFEMVYSGDEPVVNPISLDEFISKVKSNQQS